MQTIKKKRATAKCSGAKSHECQRCSGVSAPALDPPPFYFSHSNTSSSVSLGLAGTGRQAHVTPLLMTGAGAEPWENEVCNTFLRLRLCQQAWSNDSSSHKMCIGTSPHLSVMPFNTTGMWRRNFSIQDPGRAFLQENPGLYRECKVLFIKTNEAARAALSNWTHEAERE